MALVFAAPAHAGLPVPMDPENPAVAEQWVNPQIRTSDGSENITLSLVDAPSSADSGSTVDATVRVRNDGDEQMDNLTATVRRGPVSGSVADARVATIASPEEYTVAGDTVEVPDLAPGEEAEITVQLEVSDQPLAATFPVMVVLEQDGTHLDSERWHMGVKGDLPEDQTPAGVSVLYPVSAPVDIVPGETGEAPNRPPLILASEQVADQLEPGGRLDQLVETYIAATEDDGLGEAACLALDPALVDTVDRMAQGYTVDDDRPAPGRQRQRLRDSWGGEDAAVMDAAPGRGADNAAAWIKKVKAASASGCTVALPWANADLNAVARTGDRWLMREAVERGPFTLGRVLGTPILHNVVVPGAGYLTPESAPAMGWADHSRSTVPQLGMQNAWETQQLQTPEEHGGKVEGDQQTTLDATTLPNTQDVAAPEPEEPVRVLVADNTVPGPRFATATPGVVTVGFDAELASTLAATGSYPETTGYSQENLRFDYTMDSVAARDLTAASAIMTAARTAGEEPVLVTPPAAWDASTAQQVMGTVAELMGSRTAEPVPLEEYTRVPDQVDSADPEALGTPYNDPSVYSDTEILNAGQQARYIDDLTSILANDSAIALTRYGYTLPLRLDLLAALPVTQRRAQTFYTDAELRTRTRLNGERDTLGAIKASISLIPPGNVYTRTSEASPLLIVAENGLPLPVDASILYQGPAGANLNTPAEFRIPARGSLTLQMTANLPHNNERTDLQLYLSTPDNRPISQPVNIAVQTAGGAFATRILVAGLAALFALAVLFQLGKRRRAH
nr:Uncharacterised protein [Streptococcus thermophilus]